MSEAIGIAIDFKSAAAYLAIEATRALERRLGLAFDWLPIELPGPVRPAPAAPGDDRGTRHRRIREEYLANDLRRYAAARGLDLGDVSREPDTTNASLGLLWLRRRAPALVGDYVTRVFDRIWQENAEVDLGFVEQSLGGHTGAFRSYVMDDGPRELECIRAELAAAGVWKTPAYLVAGDLFIGREHLPMVEWLAGGRTGPPPI
jgi:2-hydroxychromene-2-carboxylate isomerase